MLAEKAKASFSKSKTLKEKKELNYSSPLPFSLQIKFLLSVLSAMPALCLAHGRCLLNSPEQTFWEYLLQFAPCLEPCG